MFWLIVLMAVEKILSVAYITAKTIQCQTMIVSQQREALENLVDTLIDNLSVQNVSD